jgi:hypothetical protein
MLCDDKNTLLTLLKSNNQSEDIPSSSRAFKAKIHVHHNNVKGG